MRFLLEGPCVLEVHGDEAAWDRQVTYFKEELLAASPTESGAGKIVLRVDMKIGHEPVSVFGVSGGVLADGRFVVPDGAGHWCSFDPAALRVDPALRIEVDVCCTQIKANVLLDWILLPLAQFINVGAGDALLHASAASLKPGEDPLVFSAWSGVGKTNLVLHALAQGGDYYGDDRVIVTNRGTVVPSSRRVSIYGYNRTLANGLGAKKRRKLRLGDRLHRASRRIGGRPGFVLSYAANGFGSARASAQELGGRSGVPRTPRAHVFCFGSSAMPDGEPAVFERVPGPEVRAAANGHVAVMEYEFIWFQRYIQTWRWATLAPRDPWRELTDALADNIADYLQSVPEVFRLTLPKGSPATVAPFAWDLMTSKLA